ncbi:MAG: D-cysteine desulfhydrase family protein [Treponema sp.]|jgi:D-cysteine desulfhydrase family pyridoxal phosphate-dependent enzyme|nr:D-cysteine desulfhydrase family protein [Treponema sp.]
MQQETSLRRGIEKIRLGYYPTPLARLENISRETGVNFYIKRDDLCGIAFGGNKVRKLEYLLAHAKGRGFDTILTTGSAQSNHAVLTAACCRKLGLEVLLLLKKRGVTETRGNLLLAGLMNIPVRFIDTDSYADVYAEAETIMETMRAAGKNPWLIPVGGSVPLGALGYLDAAEEIASQAGELGFPVHHIICCSGSGGTHAGLLLGAKKLGARVTGIVVSAEENFQAEIYRLVLETAKLAGIETDIVLEDVVLKEYIGPGYAQPSKEGDAAILFMAEKEGIFLDPVYTGKTFAGFLDLLSKGFFAPDENVVFVHTGGGPAIFALYP